MFFLLKNSFYLVVLVSEVVQPIFTKLSMFVKVKDTYLSENITWFIYNFRNGVHLNVKTKLRETAKNYKNA